MSGSVAPPVEGGVWVCFSCCAKGCFICRGLGDGGVREETRPGPLRVGSCYSLLGKL